MAEDTLKRAASAPPEIKKTRDCGSGSFASTRSAISWFSITSSSASSPPPRDVISGGRFSNTSSTRTLKLRSVIDPFSAAARARIE